MSDLINEIIWKVDGVLTDALTVPVLNDASNTFGVRQVDNAAVIIPPYNSGANPASIYTRINTGVYQYTLTTAAANVSYEFASQLTWFNPDTSANQTEQLSTVRMLKTIPMPAGVYHSKADIESMFGRGNVRIWSSLGPEDDWAAMAARIQGVINWTESYVNSRLRRSKYIIPFSLPIPLEITEICAHISGSKLYEPRTSEDFNSDGQNPLKTFVATRRKDAEGQLQMILAGKLEIDAPLDVGITEYPTVVVTDRMRIKPVRYNDMKLVELANIIMASDCGQNACFNDT